jgi:hypothetical protein
LFQFVATRADADTNAVTGDAIRPGAARDGGFRERHSQ